MAAILTVEIVGKDRVLAGIAAFQTVLKDLRPFWTSVFAPTFFADVQDLFAMQGQSRGPAGRFGVGGRWAALAPRYAAWKKKHFPGKGILERTGRLRQSMAWRGHATGPEGFFDAQPAFAVAGTTVPYGVHHQTGTGRMPARPFLPRPDPAVYAPLLRNWVLREVQKKRR